MRPRRGCPNPLDRELPGGVLHALCGPHRAPPRPHRAQTSPTKQCRPQPWVLPGPFRFAWEPQPGRTRVLL